MVEQAKKLELHHQLTIMASQFPMDCFWYAQGCHLLRTSEEDCGYSCFRACLGAFKDSPIIWLRLLESKIASNRLSKKPEHTVFSLRSFDKLLEQPSFVSKDGYTYCLLKLV